MHNDPTWKHYKVKPTSYVAPKVALNAYTIVLDYDLRDTPFKVNALDHGYAATDFNNQSNPGTVPDTAAKVVKAAVLNADGPTGQFSSDDNVRETGTSTWQNGFFVIIKIPRIVSPVF